MKEALKLCVAELSEARGEVEEVMHNCAAALAGTEKGGRYVAQYRQQLARIDAAIAAAEAAMAQPEPEPVAWSTGISWRMPAHHQSEQIVKLTRCRQAEHGFVVPLYAGSALAQSLIAHPTP